MGRELHIPLSSSLRCFEAAARLGSHQAAADELGRTPSAVSHQIRSLEATLGVALFRKVGRNAVLTAPGAIYAAAAARAIGELVRAQALMAGERPADTIRLSVGPGFALLFAVPQLSRFRESNPGLSLSLNVDARPVDLRTSAMDAAVRVAHVPSSGLASHRIMRNGLRPMARTDVWARLGPEAEPPGIANLPLIGYRGAEGAWEAWFSAHASGVRAPQVDLVCDSVAAAIQMAEAGMGVMLAPYPLAARLLSGGTLSAPFQKDLDERGDYFLVFRPDERRDPKILRLLDWLAPEAAAGESLQQTEVR